MTPEERRLPLSGLNVADFSWFAAGPICAEVMGLYGATVVRVESESHVDGLRGVGPFAQGKTGYNVSGYFNNYNANKLSVTIDLNTEKGRDLALRLVAWADVFITNMTPRIIERWRPRLSRVNITPVYQVPENLAKVMGDWRALEQVFTNLISNATEAMSQNGGILSVKLGMTTDSSGRKNIEVAVSDNGPGIPDEIRGRIFEPFVTTKQTGTGLGLAITKRNITGHRGAIKVESFPGGTVFTVTLPTIKDEA